LHETPRATIFGAVLGQRLIVVSDAHFRRETAPAEAGFLDFLERLPSLGDSLLVNGDLFDFWFSYRRVVPRVGLPVAAALGRLARRIPIVMTGGNHDRWGGTFWERDLGVRFCPGEARFRVGSREVLAIHGDGLTDRDWSARLLHRLTSNPVTVAAFAAIHPDVGHWLVDRLSDWLGSPERDPAVLERSAERQRAWAEERLAQETGLGVIIMGHTHRDTLTEPMPGRHYLNPGAWFLGGRYAVVSDELTALRTFEG
jgi:UDP-2,3-diacylglucosamine hydrolase